MSHATYKDNYNLIKHKFLIDVDESKLQAVTFPKGTLMIDEGDQLDSLLFVLSGKIKISQSYENGKTLLLQIMDGFTILGDIEYFLKTNAYCRVEAINEVKVVKVTYDFIDRNYRKKVSFLENVLIQTNEKVLQTNNKASLNLMYSLDIRLASYMLGISTTNTVILPNLTDVANLLGTSYRHLHRTLKKLEDASVITKHNKVITILDRNKLLEIGRGNIYERENETNVYG